MALSKRFMVAVSSDNKFIVASYHCVTLNSCSHLFFIIWELLWGACDNIMVVVSSIVPYFLKLWVIIGAVSIQLQEIKSISDEIDGYFLGCLAITCCKTSVSCLTEIVQSQDSQYRKCVTIDLYNVASNPVS